MRTVLIVCACLVSAGAQAMDWGTGCEHSRKIDQTLDLSDSSELAVMALAGELEIRGVEGSDEARIRGRACASEEKWLDEISVETQGGENAEIRVVLPETDGGWSILGNDYAFLDLELEVPAHIGLDVKDSSGDMEIEGVGPLAIQDSSGEIEIEGIDGPVRIQDSSGEIELSDIRGSVTVLSDSSGDIGGSNITGSVLIEKDSSGDIRFRDVGENFVVEKDSSGDIRADGVGGNFEVMQDGSGDIQAINVTGTVTTPDDRS